MASKHTKAVYFCRVHCTYIQYIYAYCTYCTYILYSTFCIVCIIYSMLYTYICSTYIVFSVNITGSDDFSVEVCVCYPHHRAAVDTSRNGDLGSCSLLSPFAQSGMFANFGCDGEP